MIDPFLDNDAWENIMGEVAVKEPPTEAPLPVPRFSIGDTVYWATHTTTSVPATCPDCLDTKKWTVRLPSGDQFDVACERCGRNYGTVATFHHKQFLPDVRSFTVRSMTVKSHAGWGRDEGPGVEYMSNIGGGTVIEEKKLFATHDDAMARAVEIAAKAEADFLASEHGVRERERRSISTYRLKEAINQDAQNEARDWRHKYDGLIALIQELPEAYISGHDSDLKELHRVWIARYLLDDCGEPHPEKWEAKYG